MTTTATVAHAMSTDALDFLASFDRAAFSAACFNPARINEWGRLHEAYFGSSAAPKQQARCGRLARQGGFSVDQLLAVEKRLGQLPKAQRTMRARMELLERLVEAAPRTYEAFARLVKEFVPVEERAPQPGLRFGRSRSRFRGMYVNGPERDLADIEANLRAHIDPSQPEGPQLYHAFMSLLRGRTAATGAGTAAGIAPAAPRPIIAVPLPDIIAIEGHTADDVLLGLSDGTTITGTEYLAAGLGLDNGKDVELALVHPTAGPVKSYRLRRFAGDEQRLLASLRNLVCAWPGCKRAADFSQVHHVRAWRDGGETNIDNLVILCPFHNAVNDDDTSRSKWGRIELIDGHSIWISPYGRQAVNTYHRYGVMETLFPDPPDPPDPPS